MNIKKLIVLPLLAAVLPLCAQDGLGGAPAGGQEPAPVLTTENGYTIVNTTSLAEDVEGYAGPTPLKIFIKKDKVEKIEPLKNIETPKYFALIRRDLFGKWDGLSVKKAATQEVDVVTGATFSSKAVIENVRRGADYYVKHGKKKGKR